MKPVFIYALNCSAGRTRYIGKTKNPRDRVSQHVCEARRETHHRACWIKSLGGLGVRPILEILDEVPEAEASFWEREYIRLYKALGFDLVNGTDGGEGIHNPSPEVRKKFQIANRGENNPAYGSKASADTILQRVQKLKGRRRTTEQRAKMSASHVGQVSFRKGLSGEALKFSTAVRSGRKILLKLSRLLPIV